MRGIILAGGLGTRLYPLTISTSKQLLPISDKPMIYYPLSVLMKAGIKEILIISTSQDIPRFKKLFGTGSDIGISLSYATQDKPDGIANAFIIGKEFIGDNDVALILGDNIFYGNGLEGLMQSSIEKLKNGIASVFGYFVKTPEEYGVVEFDKNGKVISIEEKPSKPKSNYAVVGLYFYPNSVTNLVNNISPSSRGELEITSLNNAYLNIDKLDVVLLERGFAWLDTGSHENLLEASNYINLIENRQGLKVGCIEEIAYKLGYINKEQLIFLANRYSKTQYGNYLKSLIQYDF